MVKYRLKNSSSSQCSKYFLIEFCLVLQKDQIKLFIINILSSHAFPEKYYRLSPKIAVFFQKKVKNSLTKVSLAARGA
jgi:hypothetical protein